MMYRKKNLVISGLLVFTITASTATQTKLEEEPRPVNLKVLPKDISSNDLDRIMYTFEKQLGVTCVYCHANTKNIIPVRVDFASDEKPEKLAAREMLKMTIRLNKKYFHAGNTKKVIQLPVIWCRTCHRGFPVPQYPVQYPK